MGKAMYEERTYERKQEIEIRAARGGNVQTWVRAKIDSLTSRGAYVTILSTGRSAHLAWRDMRHIGSGKEEETQQVVEPPTIPKGTFSNPVLSKELAEKFKQPTPPEQQEQPLATVTPIRPVIEEAPDTVMENAQRLVNVSRGRRSTTRQSNPILAALLKSARELEKLTQQDVAQLVNTSQVMVSRFERADIAPDDDMLVAYHEQLGMDLELLLLARDKPEEAKDYKPTPPPVQQPPVAVPPSPPAIAVPKMEPVVMEVIKPKEAQVQEAKAALAMEDFFEFCDKMELICPQPSDPLLRKQWRELAKGMFELRSKL